MNAGFLSALILTFSPQEKEQPPYVFDLVEGRPANPVTGFPTQRRKILLLLGEKAGLREDVIVSVEINAVFASP